MAGFGDVGRLREVSYVMTSVIYVSTPVSPESLARLMESTESPTLEFAYVDESGDSGSLGSQTYTLGCLLVPADDWTTRLDLMIGMRRKIKEDYGIRFRDELKANYLLRGRGALAGLGLGDGQRRDIYQRHLRLIQLVGSGAFAVVIQKHLITTGKDPAVTAWTYLFQRLRTRSETTGVPIMLVHDEGDADRVRKLHRAFRRHSWAGNTPVTARLLVEDPVPRRSDQSFFIQTADLLAYAAYRRVHPPAGRASGSVCNEQMWDELGPRILKQVARDRTDGIVIWPKA